jgi:predicted peroxiredoxin
MITTSHANAPEEALWRNPDLPRAAPPAGNHYTVILTSGAEDGGKRATLAASMACTALSMDLRTHLFLVGDGSYWAYEGHADGIQVAGFPALEELLDSFVLLGGALGICSTCDQALCHAAGSADHSLKRRAGAEIQGMAALMEPLMRGQAVTF